MLGDETPEVVHRNLNLGDAVGSFVRLHNCLQPPTSAAETAESTPHGNTTATTISSSNIHYTTATMTNSKQKWQATE